MKKDNIMVLGGDGFCGWPTSLGLSKAGYDVTIVDNLSRRKIDIELGCDSLTPIKPIGVRLDAWGEKTGKEINYVNLDVALQYNKLLNLIKETNPKAIVHFAEQRAAPYSMKSSSHKRYTVNNNTNAIHNTLAAIVESGLDSHLVHLGCYDDKTEIFTKKGWKLFKDLTNKDKVATRIEGDRTIVFKKPKSIHKYTHKGRMYKVQSSRVDFCVTPNHRIFTLKRSNNKYGPLKLEYAKDIIGKSRHYDLTFDWDGKVLDKIDIMGKKINIKTWVRFLGWYLSEGCCVKQNGKYVRVTMKQRVKSYKSKIMKKDLNKFSKESGLKFTERKEKLKSGGYTGVFTFCNVKFTKYLSKFGKQDKRYIPMMIKDLDKKTLDQLFSTLILGDGSIYNRGFKYGTISKQLAEDVQEIAIKIGWSANISLRKKSTKDNNLNDIYTVNICPTRQTYIQKECRKDKWVNYNGKVYCVDVGDGHGIVYVKRNGKCLWSGNTTGYYGYSDVGMEIPEGYLKVKVDVEGEDKDIEIMYPPKAGSIYHMTKVNDAMMFNYYNKNDGLRITDLHQGIVWGTQTPETKLDERLINRFDYDGDYGTVLNRFLMQAAVGHPLTVHGTGGQTRAFINLKNTVDCVKLAIENPANYGERVKVLNQTTECLNVGELAKKIRGMTGAEIRYFKNPRKEDPKNDLRFNKDTFLKLGLNPVTLDEGLLSEIVDIAGKYKDRCDKSKIICTSVWKKGMPIDFEGSENPIGG